MRLKLLIRFIFLLLLGFPLGACQEKVDTILTYDVNLGDPSNGMPRIYFSLCIPAEFVEAAKKNLSITIDLVENPDWTKNKLNPPLASYVNNGTIVEGSYQIGSPKIKQENFAAWNDKGCISGNVSAFHGTQDWHEIYPIAQIKFNVHLVRGETEVNESYTYQIPGQKKLESNGGGITGDVILDAPVETSVPTSTATPAPTATITPEPTKTPTPLPVRLIPGGAYLTAEGNREQIAKSGKVWSESKYVRTVKEAEVLSEWVVRLDFVEDFMNEHFTDDHYTVDYDVYSGQQVDGTNTGAYQPKTFEIAPNAEYIELMGKTIPVVFTSETLDMELGNGFTAQCDKVERYRSAIIEITLKYSRECSVFDNYGNYWGTDNFSFVVTDTNLVLDLPN
jgi:hypothetical protein